MLLPSCHPDGATSDPLNTFAVDAKTEHAQLLEAIAPYRRTAYLPRTEEVPSAFDATAKFGGYPYLHDPQDWPTCPNCGRHRQLLLQLDLTQIPDRPSAGLLQLFYCTNQADACERDLRGWEPFSDIHAIRIVKPDGKSATTVPQLPGMFPERRIISWEACDDYPHPEDYGEFDIYGTALELDAVRSMMEAQGQLARGGDKLFGWPAWVQGPEYHLAQNGGRPMTFLLQLSSQGNLPYLFGDAGTGYLMRGKGRMGFGWAGG